MLGLWPRANVSTAATRWWRGLVFAMRELEDARWAAVRAEVARFPRLCGYYLVTLVAMEPGWEQEEEPMLGSSSGSVWEPPPTRISTAW